MFEISPKKVGSSTAVSVDGNIALYDGTGSDTIKDSGQSLSTVGINFSYNIIESADTITVPVKQQMIVKGDFILDGTLELNGDLALI